MYIYFKKELLCQNLKWLSLRAKRIDVFINNTGVSMVGAAEETSINEAKWMFDTNVFGILRTSKAVLTHMRAQRSGRIIKMILTSFALPTT